MIIFIKKFFIFEIITIMALFNLFADDNVKIVKGKVVSQSSFSKAALDEVEVSVPVVKGRLVSTPYQKDYYYYNDDSNTDVTLTLGLSALFFGIYAHNPHCSYRYRTYYYTPYYERYYYRRYYPPHYYRSYNRGHHNSRYGKRSHSRDYSRRRR